MRRKSGHGARSRPYQETLVILVLGAMALTVFWQTGRHEFIYLDDTIYVSENFTVLRGWSWEGLRWAFSTIHSFNWHPLTWLSHMTDVELFGLDAGRHHVVSVAFHTLNTALLFLVLRLLTGTLWRSAAVAALFAVHPLHVESVAWVAERKDVLSAFFWIVAMGAYGLYVRRPGGWRYTALLLLFGCGLLSKPMVVTLPAVLLLLDLWPLRRWDLWGGGAAPGFAAAVTGRPVLEKIPLILLSAVSSMITFYAQRAGGAVGSLEQVPFGLRLSNALISYVVYAGKMFWPSKLAIYYPLGDRNNSWVLAGGALLVTALVTVLVLWQGRRRPYLTLGWLWYLGTLVPVIGVVQVGSQAMADRYTYIPLIGLFIVLAWGWFDLWKSRRFGRFLMGTSAAAVLAALMTAAHAQTSFWADSIRLFTHTLEVTDRNHIIHNNLGLLLSQRGEPEKATAHFREAMRIPGGYDLAARNLSMLQQGIAAAGPGDSGVAAGHGDLGSAYLQQGRFDDAIAFFQRTLELAPGSAAAHHNLGLALYQKGRLEEAIEHYRVASLMAPRDVQNHNNLGTAYYKLNRDREALESFMKAINLQPDYVDAHFNLGLLHLKSGNRQGVQAEYNTLLKLDARSAGEFARIMNK